MVIYVDEDTEYHEGLRDSLIECGNAAEIDLNNGKTILDLGSINDPSLLEEILGNCVNKSFKVSYCYRHMYDQNVFNRGAYTVGMYDLSLNHRAKQVLQEQTAKYENIICVLPFKMMNIFMTQVPKNSSYIQENDAHAKATAVLQCINDHRGQEDKVIVSKSVRKYKL